MEAHTPPLPNDTLKLPRAENVSPTPSPLSSSPGGASTSTGAAEDTSDASAVKEKRKRTRVTPEQLEQLESFFAADRSPTAARRKEISDLLGMQERQTQVWFQNRYARRVRCDRGGFNVISPLPDRRAKAKHLEGGKHAAKAKASDSEHTLSESPPPLVNGNHDVELQNMMHESEGMHISPRLQ